MCCCPCSPGCYSGRAQCMRLHAQRFRELSAASSGFTLLQPLLSLCCGSEHLFLTTHRLGAEGNSSKLLMAV
eukprot:14386070-Alexandrium_andersonii.AAC.1